MTNEKRKTALLPWPTKTQAKQVTGAYVHAATPVGAVVETLDRSHVIRLMYSRLSLIRYDFLVTPIPLTKL